MSKPIQTVEELGAVLHWRGKHAQAIRERDALQQLLNQRDEQVESLKLQPQGEPVALDERALYDAWRESNLGYVRPFNKYEWSAWQARARHAEQHASVGVVMPDRSPQDYAIEHAEYMAKSADGVLAKFQAYGLALLAVDEGGDDGEGELFEAIDSARGELQESLVDLRSMVYEFRKRAEKTR